MRGVNAPLWYRVGCWGGLAGANSLVSISVS